jgi:hypothetical protein
VRGAASDGRPYRDKSISVISTRATRIRPPDSVRLKQSSLMTFRLMRGKAPLRARIGGTRLRHSTKAWEITDEYVTIGMAG